MVYDLKRLGRERVMREGLFMTVKIIGNDCKI
jgi:hypothetical protein